jgi:NAD+ kinase
MAVIGMILHHEREQAAELARDAATWLVERGHEVRLPLRDAGIAGLPELGSPEGTFARGLDLAVSLGGDGTMLRTVDLVAGEGVPVVGVNVGQLGYLTEVEPPGLRMALKRFLAGSYELEERMLLEVTVEAADPLTGVIEHDEAAATAGQNPPRVDGSSFLALNEAVLEKTPMGHTVRLGVSIDGEAFTPYAADGLIVATPTGSTAYAFSARGPIVEPTHRCLLMTPVSPHMLFDRSLVFAPDARVRIDVVSDRPATLSVDGHNLGTLRQGDAVTCTAAPGSARFLTFGPRNFLRILKTKFGLSDR